MSFELRVCNVLFSVLKFVSLLCVYKIIIMIGFYCDNLNSSLISLTGLIHIYPHVRLPFGSGPFGTKLYGAAYDDSDVMVTKNLQFAPHSMADVYGCSLVYCMYAFAIQSIHACISL